MMKCNWPAGTGYSVVSSSRVQSLSSGNVTPSAPSTQSREPSWAAHPYNGRVGSLTECYCPARGRWVADIPGQANNASIEPLRSSVSGSGSCLLIQRVHHTGQVGGEKRRREPHDIASELNTWQLKSNKLRVSQRQPSKCAANTKHRQITTMNTH